MAPQYVFSAAMIAERLRLPVQRVRKALKHLPFAQSRGARRYDGRRAAMALRREWPDHFAPDDLSWLETA